MHTEFHPHLKVPPRAGIEVLSNGTAEGRSLILGKTRSAKATMCSLLAYQLSRVGQSPFLIGLKELDGTMLSSLNASAGTQNSAPGGREISLAAKALTVETTAENSQKLHHDTI
jgi:hypothetical protein